MLANFNMPNEGRGQPQKETTLDLIQRLAGRDYSVTRDPKNRYRMICPVCNYMPRGGGFTAFSIQSDQNQWHCFACGEGGGYAKMAAHLDGATPIQFQPPKVSTAPHVSKGKGQNPALEGASLKKLCQAKGLDPQWCRDLLGWRDSHWYKTPAVEMPYYNEGGEPGPVRYRVGVSSQDRFRGKGKQTLYGLWDLPRIRALGRVIVVEGETDFATLYANGYPVIAVPGASMWKAEHARMLDGVKLYLWREEDTGGTTLFKKLTTTVSEVFVVTSPEGVKDPNELHQQHPDNFHVQMDGLISNAVVYVRPMGIAPRTSEGPLTIAEIAALLGSALPTRIEHENTPNDASVVIGKPSPTPITTLASFVAEKWENLPLASPVLSPPKSPKPAGESRPKKLRLDALWEHCRELFPDDVQHPPVGPLGVFGLKAAPDRGFVAHLYSSTWQSPSNCQNNKRKVVFHLYPRLQVHRRGGGNLYLTDISADDWGTANTIKNFGNRLRRRGIQWWGANNLPLRGVVRVLSSAPINADSLLIPPHGVFKLLAFLVKHIVAGGVGSAHFWGCAAWRDNLTASPDTPCDQADLLGLISCASHADVARCLTNNGAIVSYTDHKAFRNQVDDTLNVSKTSSKTLAGAVRTFNGKLTLKGKEALGWVEQSEPDAMSGPAAPAVDLEQFKTSQAAMQQRAVAGLKAQRGAQYAN